MFLLRKKKIIQKYKLKLKQLIIYTSLKTIPETYCSLKRQKKTSPNYLYVSYLCGMQTANTSIMRNKYPMSVRIVLLLLLSKKESFSIANEI